MSIRSSRDTFAYPSFLNKVEGKSGVLFALQDDTHRFGAFIDGQLKPPADAAQTNWYEAPLFFFSLSGAFAAPTKIELPEGKQWVDVAGTQGVVTDENDVPAANVAIGRSPAGNLWLGSSHTGPAADLSRCQQWINVEDPFSEAGYQGAIDEDGDGTLARTMVFTSTEMEVWQVSDRVRERQTAGEQNMCVACM